MDIPWLKPHTLTFPDVHQAIRERGEVVIHRPDGRIRDSNSYGNDPFPPKG